MSTVPLRDPDDAHVIYTVKELLGTIQTEQAAGFARIETSMSGKADKADVARMEARLDSHGERLGALEQEHKSRQQFWVLATKVGGTVVGVAVILEALSVAHVI